jgi:ribosomal protein S18 acetylase RimI-like enzyme
VSRQPQLRRVAFDAGTVEDIIDFAAENAVRPFHPRRQLRRFLGGLISSPRLVIDVHDDGGRIACAALLDNIRNPSNSACLEMLGLVRDAPAPSVYALILDQAKAELPADQAGIEFGYHDGGPVDLQFLEDRGFHPFYTMFEMLKQNDGRVAAALPPEGYGWRSLSPADVPEYHRIWTLAFAENLEASISSPEEMAAHLASRGMPGTLLLHGDRIVGFLNVSVDDEDPSAGEIGGLGLLPAYRGRGLGKLLLERAIEELASRHVQSFRLTVAAANETALRLYRRSGFEISDRDLCLRFAASAR